MPTSFCLARVGLAYAQPILQSFPRDADRRKAHCPANVRVARARRRHPFSDKITLAALATGFYSSRTGFPAAAAAQAFLPLRQPKKKDAAVKHAPCGPVLVPVDRGPEAARERIGKKNARAGTAPAFAVTARRSERRPAQARYSTGAYIPVDEPFRLEVEAPQASGQK